MATITTKVCDRCGAQHVRDDRVSTASPVRKVTWLLPVTDMHGGASERSIEMCTPCRVALNELINGFIKEMGLKA